MDRTNWVNKTKIVTIVDNPKHTNIVGGHTIPVWADSLSNDDYPYRVASAHMMVSVHRDDIASERPATVADCNEWKDSV